MKVIVVDSLINSEYTFYLCFGLNKAGVVVCLILLENISIWKPVYFVLKRWTPTKDPSAGKVLKKINIIYIL